MKYQKYYTQQNMEYKNKNYTNQEYSAPFIANSNQEDYKNNKIKQFLQFGEICGKYSNCKSHLCLENEKMDRFGRCCIHLLDKRRSNPIYNNSIDHSNGFDELYRQQEKIYRNSQIALINRDNKYNIWHPHAERHRSLPNLKNADQNDSTSITLRQRRHKETYNESFDDYNFRTQQHTAHSGRNFTHIKNNMMLTPQSNHYCYFKDNFQNIRKEDVARGRTPIIDPKMAAYMGRITLDSKQNLFCPFLEHKRDLLSSNFKRQIIEVNVENEMEEIRAAESLVKLINAYKMEKTKRSKKIKH